MLVSSRQHVTKQTKTGHIGKLHTGSFVYACTQTDGMSFWEVTRRMRWFRGADGCKRGSRGSDDALGSQPNEALMSDKQWGENDKGILMTVVPRGLCSLLFILRRVKPGL